MKQETATIIEHHDFADSNAHFLELNSPGIAALIKPGQFVMLKPQRNEPLLGRAFALFDIHNSSPNRPMLHIVYYEVGKMTRILAEECGVYSKLDIWGPLGQPFPELGFQEEVILVAGGIGMTPFMAFQQHLRGMKGYGGESPRKRTDKVSFYYGARNASAAVYANHFKNQEKWGLYFHQATDDGSAGYHGFVTDLLDSHNPKAPIVGCGPEPMLKALAKVAAKHNVPCYLSLETPMACGFGACFSCVTKVKTADGWDYKRTCVDGPSFDAKSLVWD